MNDNLSSNAPSAELEREVEATRHRMVHTLDQIRERVSPSNVVDQALDYARHSGAPDMARRLGRTVRQNPLPFLLIGAGVGWLIAGNRRRRHDGADSPTEPYSDAPVSDPTLMGTDATSIYGLESGTPQGEHAAEGASRIRLGARRITEKLAEAKQDAAAKLDGARQGASAKTSDMWARAADVTANARLKMRDAGDYAKQSWTHTVQEQPLVLIGVGFVLGAGLGALVPLTQTEHRALGPTSDSIKARAREVAAEKLQQARQSVRQTADEVVSDLQQRGYSESGAEDAARSAAEGATAVVQGSERSH